MKLNAIRPLRYKKRGIRFEANENYVGCWIKDEAGLTLQMSFDRAELIRLRRWLELVVPSDTKTEGAS